MDRLLSLADAPGERLAELLQLSARMKAEGPDPTLLAGKQIALLFLNPSLRTRTSMELAAEIAAYDLVCLQEVDLGGRRANYRSQVEDIAALSGHDHVAVQENRRIPGVSRHGNAILSRWPMTQVRDLKLPGQITGRGCLVAEVKGKHDLTIACLHLSLGRSDQVLQLAAVAEALRGARAWAAMGDFNCVGHGAPLEAFCEISGGRLRRPAPPTFPAWRPRWDYDHIVTGGEVLVRSGR